jgi:hypothetical protein
MRRIFGGADGKPYDIFVIMGSLGETMGGSVPPDMFFATGEPRPRIWPAATANWSNAR